MNYAMKNLNYVVNIYENICWNNENHFKKLQRQQSITCITAIWCYTLRAYLFDCIRFIRACWDAFIHSETVAETRKAKQLEQQNLSIAEFFVKILPVNRKHQYLLLSRENSFDLLIYCSYYSWRDLRSDETKLNILTYLTHFISFYLRDNWKLNRSLIHENWFEQRISIAFSLLLS